MSNFNKKNFIQFLKNKNNTNSIIISKSFGALCEKIKLDNNQQFIIKYYSKKNSGYNAIFYEGKSLKFMHKKFPHLFP